MVPYGDNKNTITYQILNVYERRYEISNIFSNYKIYCIFNSNNKFNYKNKLNKNIFWIKSNLIKKNFNKNFPKNVDLIIHMMCHNL